MEFVLPVAQVQVNILIILFMSYEINGAKRWLKLWLGISLQPSEFLKPCFSITRLSIVPSVGLNA